jgi:hypothetical protein
MRSRFAILNMLHADRHAHKQLLTALQNHRLRPEDWGGYRRQTFVFRKQPTTHTHAPCSKQDVCFVCAETSSVRTSAKKLIIPVIFMVS